MAPLPPESTGRVYLDYSVAGHQHTLIGRFRTGDDPLDVVDAMQTLIGIMDTQLYESSFVGLRQSNDGSNVTFPLSASFLSSWGDGAATGNETAQYFDWVGRSIDGRRVRAALFGAKIVSNNDIFRIPASVGGLWQDVVDFFNGLVGPFCTISEQVATWHAYTNTGINAYWRNTLR